MTKKRKALPIFEETKTKAKQLHPDYFQKYIDLSYDIFHKEANQLKANLLLEATVEALLTHQTKENNVQNITKSFISNVERKLQYKVLLDKKKAHDFEKCTIAGLWLTMASYILFLFIKEFINQKFLISFSVDLLVAALALVLVIRSLFTHKQIIERYQLSHKSFTIMITSMVIGLIITIITATIPFDITFLILVIAHFTSKRILKNELNEKK